MSCFKFLWIKICINWTIYVSFESSCFYCNGQVEFFILMKSIVSKVILDIFNLIHFHVIVKLLLTNDQNFTSCLNWSCENLKELGTVWLRWYLIAAVHNIQIIISLLKMDRKKLEKSLFPPRVQTKEQRENTPPLPPLWPALFCHFNELIVSKLGHVVNYLPATVRLCSISGWCIKPWLCKLTDHHFINMKQVEREEAVFWT